MQISKNKQKQCAIEYHPDNKINHNLNINGDQTLSISDGEFNHKNQ